jgi:hypothetical protein
LSRHFESRGARATRSVREARICRALDEAGVLRVESLATAAMPLRDEHVARALREALKPGEAKSRDMISALAALLDKEGA